ncbi:MAG: ribosomal-protein-alanine N-acetyltransferase [Syntrophobacteraceae bacterium CG07_land_8_20_14_0_80_61_8]|nr:MAG: ribosomal-protein-alanine N-acetyltransferase [Syntrophobacteraceae bacterium CG07_land_8_20_14_0_80_61_8]
MSSLRGPGALSVIPMTSADLPEVMAIELECHVEPWHEQFFLDELDKDHSRILVARDPNAGPELLGYICCWFVAGEVQVFNLAVPVAQRHRGIGRTLLLTALGEGYGRGARIALLEVRRGNAVAQALYSSLGFKPVGTRPNYYGTPAEPAVLMELEMTKSWKSRWLTSPQAVTDKEA